MPCLQPNITMNLNWILRMSCMMQIAGIGILFVFEAVRMKDVGIGETAIGLILGASSGIFIISSLFFGRLADRNHLHKAFIIWGSIGYGVLMLYFSICEHVWEFVLYSVLKSILVPMIIGMMPTLAVEAFGGARQGRSFGIYRAFGSLGFTVGAMGLPLLFNDIATISAVGSLFIFLSIPLVLQIPEPDTNPPKVAPLGFRGLHPGIKLFLIAFFFVALAEPPVHQFFSAYARELGASTRSLGLLSGLMGLVALVSLPLIGKWIDHVNPVHILALAFLAQPLRVVVTSFIGQVEMLWIPIMFHGLCWGGIEVAAIVYLSSLAKKGHKATVLSYYLAVRMLGQLFGAALSGYLAENVGYVFMFRIMSLGALVGSLIYIAGTYLPKKVRQGS